MFNLVSGLNNLVGAYNFNEELKTVTSIKKSANVVILRQRPHTFANRNVE